MTYLLSCLIYLALSVVAALAMRAADGRPWSLKDWCMAALFWPLISLLLLGTVLKGFKL